MASEATKPSALSLANLFSTCVECFGLIHVGKENDRPQLLEITKLGVQQGRLLAWGDVVGICETGNERNALLDEEESRGKTEAALQAIIDRPVHTNRITQFDSYGLKPPKKFAVGYEPALDFNRLEAFREKLYYLRERQHDGNPRRGKSATIAHWTIADTAKFESFVNLIRESIDTLVDMMDVRQRVDTAMKHDIRAFGWHPVFERARAARDMSKLKLVKEVCKDEYPEYVAAADSALAQLSQEWKDNYDSLIRHRIAQGSEIPGAASKMLAKEKRQEEKARRPSLFSSLRSKSWRKHHKENPQSATSPDDPDPPRSKSMGEGATDSDGSDPLTHTRSKSVGAIPVRSVFQEPKTNIVEEEHEIDPLTRVDTSTSTRHTEALEPITSMISRNDQYFAHHRASIS